MNTLAVDIDRECVACSALTSSMVNDTPLCADCDTAENRLVVDIFTELDGEDNSIYTVTEMTEGAIDREEYFPRYQEARATFDSWTKEAREFNNSDGDGVFLWDTALCRMVAEFTGHNGDGGSLVEFGV